MSMTTEPLASLPPNPAAPGDSPVRAGVGAALPAPARPQMSRAGAETGFAYMQSGGRLAAGGLDADLPENP